MTSQGFLSAPHPLRAFACLHTETLPSTYPTSWPSLNCLGGRRLQWRDRDQEDHLSSLHEVEELRGIFTFRVTQITREYFTYAVPFNTKLQVKRILVNTLRKTVYLE